MTALTDRLDEIAAAPAGPDVCAFFDYDGTLIDGYSAAAIMRSRLAGREIGLGELVDTVALALRGVTTEHDYAQALAATRPAIEGRSYDELMAIGRRLFTQDTASKLRPEMWRIVEAHRARGHRIVVASSATRFQIDPIAEAIGADAALATDLDVVDGVATGQIAGRPLWGPGKAAAVRGLARDWGVDLAESFAYSDGDEDVPYLEAVGRPAAVCPHDELRAVAARRGWPILDLTRTRPHPLEALVRTTAFYGTFLGTAAAGLAAGLLRRDDTDALASVLATGMDVGLTVAGVTVDVVSGREHLRAARPCVFVFNHQSKLDLPVMGHLVRDHATGIAKKEIADVPLVGPLLAAGGVAFVDRADVGKAIEQLQPVVARVRDDGLSLVVAPEGTRSATPRLGPFKKGPFHIAMQAGVPVVPVVLRNVGERMWRGAQLITPGTVQVRVLEPVDTSDWRPETVAEHTDQVRRMFVDALAGPWPDPTDAETATAQEVHA